MFVNVRKSYSVPRCDRCEREERSVRDQDKTL